MKENDKNTIPEEEINTAAVLDAYVYLNEYEDEHNFEDKPIEEILPNMDDKTQDQPEYQTVYDAAQADESIADMVLVDQSEIQGHDEGLLTACTFRDPETGDYYVVFRGTGDGKWVDNGYGISHLNSQMQMEAADYFDRVMEEVILEDESRGRILVTGHSKGGNEAMYVTYFSEYASQIDNCYALDGQGFSNETIAYVKDTFGQDYYRNQRNKIYNICGENDYVHYLGTPGADSSHVILIQTNATDFAGYHEISEMLSGAELKWVKDADGTIISAPQGEIGALVEQLAVKLTKLDEEDYEDCCIALMSALEYFMPYNNKVGGDERYGTGDVAFASPEEWLGFLAYGVPTVLVTLVGTPEGRKLLTTLAISGVEQFYNNYGIGGVVAVSLLLSMLPLGMLIANGITVLSAIWISSLLYDKIMDTLEGIQEDTERAKNIIGDIYVEIKNYIEGFQQSWMPQEKSAGKKVDDYISVDTYKLRDYALQLQMVNEKLAALDFRMKALYNKVKWKDLKNLIQADILTEESYRLKRCIAWLNETADDFEATEERILRNL